MLDKVEELYLDHLIEQAEISIDDGYGYAAMYTPDTVLPIYKRLKEINDEASRLSLELQKANEELAKVMETYGP